MNANSKPSSNFLSIKSNWLLLLVCLSGIMVITLASSVDFFCIPKQSRVFNVSNEELFLFYSVVYSLINIYVLKVSLSLKNPKFKMGTISFVTILTIQLIIISMVLAIYGQIKVSYLYYNVIFYALIYLSLASSTAFLAIAAMQFFRWFLRVKNYLVMTYALVMIVLCTNSIIGIIYLSQISLSHAKTIKYMSCSVMISSLNTPNPKITNFLVSLYDITSFFSFIFAWLVTVSMLKEYSKNKNRLLYWFIFSLPLIFFLPRYEIALYYFSSHQVNTILTSINFSSEIFGYQALNTILNLNLQLGGAFFGMAFLTIAAKLTRGTKQRNSLILTGIGLMFLFASKDISSLIISSYPPLGALSIAFLGIASYMVYVGIYNTAALAARDKKLRKELSEKIQNNMKLLRSIASSEDRLQIEKNVKHLMTLSTELQEENEQQDLTQSEIRDIVNDVILELKKKKMTS